MKSEPSNPIQIPAQRRWLADTHHFHGKLSPMFELRELPGWFEEAHEEARALTHALTAVLDKAEQLLEHDGALL